MKFTDIRKPGNKILILLTIILFVVLTLGAMKSNLHDMQSKGDIKLGYVGTMTGVAALFGNESLEGALMAIEEINALGGISGRRVTLVTEDDKGDVSEATLVWTKLILSDKVVAIVGAIMSKCSFAGSKVSQKYMVPMISPTSTNLSVTQTGDFIFRACFTDPYQGKIGAKFAYENLGARKAACLFDMGNEYAISLADSFRYAFESQGGTIVAYEPHMSCSIDFHEQLTRIISKNTDIIFIPDYYTDAAKISREARMLGFKGYLLGGDGWDSPQLVTIGGKAVENAFLINHFSSDDPRPAVQDFVYKYKMRYEGKIPDALVVLGYDAMKIMLDAISRAGSTDGKAIRDALSVTDISVVTGHLTFDDNRNPIKPAVINTILNGQQKYYCTVYP